jgi:hypothetical protein
VARWFRGGPSGGLDRALAYLATHQPSSKTEVAFAVNTSPSNLTRSPRFQRAWEEYRRQGSGPKGGRSGD